MFVEQGNWERALDTAATHGPEMLHKYVAACATEAIRHGKPVEALDLYKKYGAPAFPQNFNIYKRIAIDLFALQYDDDNLGRNNYYTWANLRDIMLELTENMSKDQDGDQATEDFKLLLLISHYLAVRAAVSSQKSLSEVATKVSVSLLRHSDIMPADKAFYEAGMAAKQVGWLNMAFVFLNRYVYSFLSS